jgi:hypothetical protein
MPLINNDEVQVPRKVVNKKVSQRGLQIILLVAALSFFNIWISKETVVIAVPNGDGTMIAQVAVARHFPYLTAEGRFRFVDGRDGQIYTEHLIRAGDQVDDTLRVVHSVVWDNNVVKLDVDANSYSGPKSFTSPK